MTIDEAFKKRIDKVRKPIWKDGSYLKLTFFGEYHGPLVTCVTVSGDIVALWWQVTDDDLVPYTEEDAKVFEEFKQHWAAVSAKVCPTRLKGKERT